MASLAWFRALSRIVVAVLECHYCAIIGCHPWLVSSWILERSCSVTCSTISASVSTLGTLPSLYCGCASEGLLRQGITLFLAVSALAGLFATKKYLFHS